MHTVSSGVVPQQLKSMRIRFVKLSLIRLFNSAGYARWWHPIPIIPVVLTGDFRVGGCHHSIWEVIPPKFILLVSVQGCLSSFLSFLAVQEQFFLFVRSLVIIIIYFFGLIPNCLGPVPSAVWWRVHGLFPMILPQTSDAVWEGGKFFWVIWFCANEVGSTIKWYQD